MKIDLWIFKLPLSECTLGKLHSYKHLSLLMEKKDDLEGKSSGSEGGKENHGESWQ